MTLMFQKFVNSTEACRRNCRTGRTFEIFWRLKHRRLANAEPTVLTAPPMRLPIPIPNLNPNLTLKLSLILTLFFKIFLTLTRTLF